MPFAAVVDGTSPSPISLLLVADVRPDCLAPLIDNAATGSFPWSSAVSRHFPAAEIPWIVRRMPWFELDDDEVEAPKVEPIAEAILSHA